MAIAGSLINLVKKRERGKPFIPYIAVLFNLAWELAATLSNAIWWSYMIWLILDFAIFLFGCYTLWIRFRAKGLLPYLALEIAACSIFVVSFSKFREFQGVSVFAIDVIMAIEFIFAHRRLASLFAVEIAILKLFGDLFAALSEMDKGMVLIIGAATLIANGLYLAMVIKDKLRVGASRINQSKE